MPYRGYWDEAEEDCLRYAVQKHGIGAWERMRHDPDFRVLKGRTGVQLKDKWRNLIKFQHLRRGEAENAPRRLYQSQQQRPRARRSKDSSKVQHPDGAGRSEFGDDYDNYVDDYDDALEEGEGEGHALFKRARPPPRPVKQEVPLTDFERLRLERIERNKQALKALFTNVELPKPPEEDTPTQAPRRRPRPVDEESEELKQARLRVDDARLALSEARAEEVAAETSLARLAAGEDDSAHDAPCTPHARGAAEGVGGGAAAAQGEEHVVCRLRVLAASTDKEHVEVEIFAETEEEWDSEDTDVASPHWMVGGRAGGGAYDADAMLTEPAQPTHHASPCEASAMVSSLMADAAPHSAFACSPLQPADMEESKPSYLLPVSSPAECVLRGEFQRERGVGRSLDQALADCSGQGTDHAVEEHVEPERAFWESASTAERVTAELMCSGQAETERVHVRVRVVEQEKEEGAGPSATGWGEHSDERFPHHQSLSHDRSLGGTGEREEQDVMECSGDGVARSRSERGRRREDPVQAHDRLREARIRVRELEAVLERTEADFAKAVAEEADLNYDRRRARRVPERQSARVAAKPRKTYQDEGSLHMEDDEEASTSFNMSGEPGFAADGHGSMRSHNQGRVVEDRQYGIYDWRRYQVVDHAGQTIGFRDQPLGQDSLLLADGALAGMQPDGYAIGGNLVFDDSLVPQSSGSRMIEGGLLGGAVLHEMHERPAWGESQGQRSVVVKSYENSATYKRRYGNWPTGRKEPDECESNAAPRSSPRGRKRSARCLSPSSPTPSLTSDPFPTRAVHAISQSKKHKHNGKAGAQGKSKKHKHNGKAGAQGKSKKHKHNGK
eukprot:CAMPEP_0114284184 /NCGR_PEP_ID=MMETSP0059-20121206/4517_1 /TAXON_ID=36894 /ORGANISM="Pyramimonas parkeae, Strain CCMP726" /LENGTH=842 /DNA_ID=CAMNT_0001404997 /DNA_START=292 /DNA_END=2817 /DNA_ORIENTATION=+